MKNKPEWIITKESLHNEQLFIIVFNSWYHYISINKSTGTVQTSFYYLSTRPAPPDFYIPRILKKGEWKCLTDREWHILTHALNSVIHKISYEKFSNKNI